MARGWESKSVESQIAEATDGKGDDGYRWTPEQMRLREQMEGLLLARTRALRDLEKAHNPRYRKMLEDKLEYIEREIGGLEKAAL